MKPVAEPESSPPEKKRERVEETHLHTIRAASHRQSEALLTSVPLTFDRACNTFISFSPIVPSPRAALFNFAIAAA